MSILLEVRDCFNHIIARLTPVRIDSAIQGFPKNVIYDNSYIPPVALPPPAFPPIRGYRCLLCISSGPHFGSPDDDKHVSAVSTSLDSIKHHLRKYHDCNLKEANSQSNARTFSDGGFITEIWIQKVYASKLGHFEVIPQTPSNLSLPDATDHAQPEKALSDSTTTVEFAIQSAASADTSQHDLCKAFFDAQVLTPLGDPQVSFFL
jgi:hypothetical protein